MFKPAGGFGANSTGNKTQAFGAAAASDLAAAQKTSTQPQSTFGAGFGGGGGATFGSQLGLNTSQQQPP